MSSANRKAEDSAEGCRALARADRDRAAGTQVLEHCVSAVECFRNDGIVFVHADSSTTP